MTRKYALQPEGYLVYFRCPSRENLLNGVWSEDPQIASCYGQDYDSPTIFMLLTKEMAKKHGNGYVFETDLEKIPAIRVRPSYVNVFIKALGRLSEKRDSLLFESSADSFPTFLEYLLDNSFIRNTTSIDDFVHSV